MDMRPGVIISKVLRENIDKPVHIIRGGSIRVEKLLIERLVEINLGIIRTGLTV